MKYIELTLYAWNNLLSRFSELCLSPSLAYIPYHFWNQIKNTCSLPSLLQFHSLKSYATLLETETSKIKNQEYQMQFDIQKKKFLLF